MNLIILLLTSCDCWNTAEGIIVDSTTGQPMDSVVVKSYINKVRERSFNMEMITDSTGYFYGSTGNTGRCTDLIIEFSKEGYKTNYFSNPSIDTIELVKE